MTANIGVFGSGRLGEPSLEQPAIRRDEVNVPIFGCNTAQENAVLLVGHFYPAESVLHPEPLKYAPLRVRGEICATIANGGERNERPTCTMSPGKRCRIATDSRSWSSVLYAIQHGELTQRCTWHIEL